MSSDKNICPVFKILLLGDTAVGKQSIFFRYMERHHKQTGTRCIPTMGDKIVNISGKDIKLNIVIPLAQERYWKHIAASLFRNCHILIFVYSIDNLQSLENLKQWKLECKQYGLDVDSMPCILLGTKRDIVRFADVEVSEAMAKKFADNNNMKWGGEVSATLDRDMPHIGNLFYNIAVHLQNPHMPLVKEYLDIVPDTLMSSCTCTQFNKSRNMI